jgi:CTP synthase
VIPALDADCIYAFPLMLHEEGLDEIVVDKLRPGRAAGRSRDWARWSTRIGAPKHEATVAMVGKYVDLTDAYKSLNEALLHAGMPQRHPGEHPLHRLRGHRANGDRCLDDADAILVPGGFGERGVEGKIAAIRFAARRACPIWASAYGMQVAVIEFARNVRRPGGCHSTEFEPATPHPVIGLITEWLDRGGQGRETRTPTPTWAAPCAWAASPAGCAGFAGASHLRSGIITERHRHRYEFNNRYRDVLQKPAGAVRLSMDEMLVEIIELPDHPWFLGCQFHPEFTSTPRDGHPLFTGFIEAALRAQQGERRGKAVN